MRETLDLTGKSLLAQGAELFKAPQGSRRVLEHSVLWCTPNNWDVRVLLTLLNKALHSFWEWITEATKEGCSEMSVCTQGQ